MWNKSSSWSIGVDRKFVHITDSIDAFSLLKYIPLLAVDESRMAFALLRRSNTIFRKRIYLFRLRLNRTKFPYRSIEWPIKIDQRFSDRSYDALLSNGTHVDSITKTDIFFQNKTTLCATHDVTTWSVHLVFRTPKISFILHMVAYVMLVSGDTFSNYAHLMWCRMPEHHTILRQSTAGSCGSSFEKLKCVQHSKIIKPEILLTASSKNNMEMMSGSGGSAHPNRSITRTVQFSNNII